MNNEKSCQSCGCDEGENYTCKAHSPARVAKIDQTAIDKAFRKQRPIYSGVLCYFPDAIMEVAHVSFLGTAQHHPGAPMHWDKTKSTDHLDCAGRHITDHATTPVDTDGGYHLAKAAWRALAELQLFLDKQKERT